MVLFLAAERCREHDPQGVTNYPGFYGLLASCAADYFCLDRSHVVGRGETSVGPGHAVCDTVCGILDVDCMIGEAVDLVVFGTGPEAAPAILHPLV
jgi:hypothetical protein